MQIVIDIPEEVKHNVHAYGLSLCPRDKDRLIHAIMNSTSLPKGHGRLIDENDLSLMTVHMIDGVLVCDAPTIIEADKEQEE